MKHFKEQTETLAIKEIPAPEIVVIPLSQHIGTATEAQVSVGDEVKVGQLIGKADAFVTAPIHSSVSGKVTAIEPRPHPLGIKVPAIIIQNDGKYTKDASCKSYPSLDQLGPNEIVELVKNSGLVGMGGATFPTHVKLQPPKEKKVDTLILNAAECEPYLTADHRVLLEETEDVLLGLKVEAKALGVKDVYIGIEDNKMDAVKKLKEAGAETFVKIKVLKTQYPTGAEKVLVKKVINRKVPPLGIPLDVGCVVSNVGTVAQIAKTMKTGLPLIERIVTLAGVEIENPGNYRVRIGTRVADLIKIKVDYNKEGSKDYKLLMGGPMMGLAQSNTEVPIIKGSSGVLFIDAVIPEEENCIRCGRCIDKCPL
ncbi:MAG: electron transport complex subunit RsxC, partial [Candidatus Margulisbacteria bacterium]|nr:electron transport complex subunit RsxC [Candidatus Margulisiibacteriota bacterium]